MTDLPPPPKIDGRRNNGGNRGGGHPPGAGVPLKAPTEIVVDATVDLALGAKTGEVAEKYHLEPSEVRRIQTLTNLTPQQFFDQMATKYEAILEGAVSNLQQRIDAGDGNIKDLTLAIGVIHDKVAGVRGAARPAIMNQTNIQINGMTAEDAKKFLLTGEIKQ